VNAFSFARPRTIERTVELMRDGDVRLTVLKAGGMDVVDHLKEGLVEPTRIVDLLGVDEARLDELGPTTIGARATLAAIEASEDIRRSAPVIAEACGSAATPQVRNVATAAGNLLQRPRCWYYRNEQFDCLKKGGDTCYAVNGENDQHAIFGGGPCFMVHPSNLALGLMVTGAVVHVTGGDRDTIGIAELFHGPNEDVTSEHRLAPHEVITHVTFQRRPSSAFHAIKHKQSFDWPMVAAAIALELDGTVVRSASVCAGAVAPVPWPLPNVEAALVGIDVADVDALRMATVVARDGAEPLDGNAHKVSMLPVAIQRAVRRAAGLGAIA